jgi:hypothetical protein
METRIVYFDETGDDGVTTLSSDHFVLTSLYMSADVWQSNFNIIREMRRKLKEDYGLHVSEEMHTKQFLTDKNPYRKYNLDKEAKQNILKIYTKAISGMDMKIINVIIDKTRFKDSNYKILENALKYNIQRIENDSNNNWNYIIITDEGRIVPMRKTARLIRAYNPIQSKYTFETYNQPIKNMVEDILEKNSNESYFIQTCDFVSFFVHLYFSATIKNRELPGRVGNVIDKAFVTRILATLKSGNVLNLQANSANDYGLVIYPR